MKNTILFFFVIAFFSFNACDHSKDDSSDTTVQQQIEDTVNSGTWKITYFNDSGNDETDHFTGYSFIFDMNGTISATKNNITYTGVWKLTDSNSNDDSPDDLDFNIQFNLSNDFEELNEDWHIISQSDDKIELIHVSGGNGGTDYLTFEKI